MYVVSRQNIHTHNIKVLKIQNSLPAKHTYIQRIREREGGRKRKGGRGNRYMEQTNEITQTDSQTDRVMTCYGILWNVRTS